MNISNDGCDYFQSSYLNRSLVNLFVMKSKSLYSLWSDLPLVITQAVLSVSSLGQWLFYFYFITTFIIIEVLGL